MKASFPKLFGTSARSDPDHILRVRSPIDASKEQLQKIQDLSGRLF